MRFLIPVNNPNDYPHKPKRLLFNITKKSPPETQNKAFLSFPVGSFYCHKAEKWLFYAKKKDNQNCIISVILIWQGQKDSNPRHAVLEQWQGIIITDFLRFFSAVSHIESNFKNQLLCKITQESTY